MEIVVGVLFLSMSFFSFLHWWIQNKNSPGFVDWPILHNLPDLLINVHRAHDYLSKVLKNTKGTTVFKGPWFCNMEFLVTSDPLNVDYILSKNFSNYPKGPGFIEIFEALGDGIFNADADLWKEQRKFLHSLLKTPKFEQFVETNLHLKLSKALFPVLDYIAQSELDVDIQDVFQRLMFDMTCLTILGFDQDCLSLDFPHVPHAKAFDVMEESVFYRHTVPLWFWKLQRRYQLGEEKRLGIAWKIFDDFVYKCISRKREELEMEISDEKKSDLISAYMDEGLRNGKGILSTMVKSDKFLRDVVFNLMAAGRDTISSGLSWFMWLLANNPIVETKILQEIKLTLIEDNIKQDGDNKTKFLFSVKEVNKLVYLHAALCESLRLYPPVPLNHKTTIEPDILPSGHRVKRNQMVVISNYSVGRHEETWGKDCLEYKPERWIDLEKNQIKFVSSYKFVAFNAGPRSCLGRDMSFIQMKIAAVAILCKYHVKLVEGHHVSPNSSILLPMKNGLKVKISKRNNM